MPILIKNHIENALDSLRSNRTRTTLTVLGVAIGIASIMIILSLSAGASQIVKNQVKQIDGGVGILRPGSPDRDLQISDLTSSIAGNQIVSGLTQDDADSIAQVQNVTSVAPMMFFGGSVTAGKNNPSNVSIIATTPALTNLVDLPLDQGQFIDSVTRRDTAVLGSQLAVDLFGTHQAVGRVFRTHGFDFTVIGVLKSLNDPINYNHIDFDHSAIIGLESGKEFNHGIINLQQINFKTDNENHLAQAVDDINQVVTKNHSGERDFVITWDGSLSEPTNELFTVIAATLSAVAGISLFVGGIGIMNIMLVSVSERTREIGVRKAIGASNAHIVWQFIIESLMMSLTGGVLGYLGGYVLAFAIARSLLTFNPHFSWEIAGWAAGLSLAVGLVFGLYPAIRAARKNPIESLRQYH